MSKTLALDETIRAAYFVQGVGQDFFGVVRQEPDGTVQNVWRFRYDAETVAKNLRVPNPKEGRNWYESSPATLQEALDQMQNVLDVLNAGHYGPKGGIACKLVRGSMTLEKYTEEFTKLPFVHVKF